MRRLALGAAGLALAAAAFVLWPGDARAIRQTLAAVADAVSEPAGEGDLQRIARAASLARRLAADVVVRADPDGPGIEGREAVVGVASRLRAGGPVTVSFDVADLVVDGPGGRATADLVAHVTGGAGGALADVDASDVRVELVRTDGAWLISRVTRVPVLRR